LPKFTAAAQLRQTGRRAKHPRAGYFSLSAMTRDISAILEEWDFRPGHLSARIISGEDGEYRIQVRLDLGLMQMHMEGRPDGLMPFSFTSLLDYHEAMVERAKQGSEGMGPDEGDEPNGLTDSSDPNAIDDPNDEDPDRESWNDDPRESRRRRRREPEGPDSDAKGDDEGNRAGSPKNRSGPDESEKAESPEDDSGSEGDNWQSGRDESGDASPLTNAECRALREEVSQYNQRAVALMALDDFDLVMRDATRNLRVIDFCKQHAAAEGDREALEQYRPYFLAMRYRALTLQLVRDGEPAAALFAVDEGLDLLKDCFAAAGKSKLLEHSAEYQALKETRDSLVPKLPLSQRAELKQRLARALEQENYELAAILRDELKQLSDESAP